MTTDTTAAVLRTTRSHRKIKGKSSATLRRRILGTGIAALLATGAVLSLPGTAFAGGGPLPATFWKGQTNGAWNATNWASDAMGTATTAFPSASEDVTFSIASGAANQGSTTLNQAFTIHSLTISDTTAVGIATGTGTNTLTIAGSSGTGITVNTGASLTISANVTLGLSSDTITVAGTGTAAISGLLGGNALTKSGTGTLTLSNSFNTYTGGTTINAGRVIATADGSLGGGNIPAIIPLAGITFYGGELLVNGATFSSARAIEIGDSATGRLSNSNTGNAASFSGGITLGVGSFLAIGSAGNTGTVVLSGTGGTNASIFVNVDFGTLQNGDAKGFTQYTSVAQTTTVAGGATLDAGGFNTTILNLQGAGTLTSGITVINPGGFSPAPILPPTPVTYTITSGNFSGAIQDGTDVVSVLKNGTSTDVLTLSGVNTYTGGTELQAGTLNINNASALGMGNFRIDSGTTIDNTSGAPITLSTNNTQDWHSDFTFTGTNDLNLGTGVVTLHGDNNSIVTATVTAGTLTVGGVIQDSIDGGEGLTKAGLGKLILTGVNTYTLGTTIKAGTLSFANGSLGTLGTVDVAGNSTLQWYGSNTQDISSRLKIEDGVNATFDTNGNNVTFATALQTGTAGTGAVTKTGDGTLTILAANTYKGGTTVAGGTLFLGNGSTTGVSLGAGDVTVNANATFQLDLANLETFPNKIVNTGHVVADDGILANYTMSGLITGTGDFTKTGTNTVMLSHVNDYTGNTYVQQGTLLAGAATAEGPGKAGNGPFGFNSAVYVSPGATLQLNGNHVSIGSLHDGTSIMLDAVPTVVQTAAIVQNSSATPATLTTGGNGNFAYFSGIIQDGNLTAIFTGRRPSAIQEFPQSSAPLSLWKIGPGTQTLAGFNRYTGTTTVSGGILQAGVSNAGGVGTTGPGAFGNNSAVTVNGTGILQLAGNNVGIGSLAGNAGGIVQNAGTGTGTLTIGGNNTDTTFAGVIQDGVANVMRFAQTFEAPLIQEPISGPLAIYKIGTGTQVLSGNNSYTGGTTLAAGTLAAGSMKAFGSGNLTMTGGTLKTSGGPLLVDIGGGNILFTGGTYVASVGGLVPAVQHDQLVTTGMANISGGMLSLMQQNGFLLKAGNQVVLLSAKGGVAGGSANGTPVPASNVMGLSAFSDTPLLVPAVNLYRTSVVLEAMQGSFKVSGLTPNQSAVAGALDSLIAKLGGKTGIFKELDFLDNQPFANLKNSLDMISPEELTAIFHLAKSLANIQTANIQQRLADLRATSAADIAALGGLSGGGGAPGPVGKRSKEIAPASDERWGMWMTGSGEFTQVGNRTNAAGFSTESAGVTAGVDYRFTDHFAAGISLGYMNTTASLSNGGKVDVDGGRVGAYATWFDRGLHLDASVSGGANGYATRRTTPNNTVATASPGGTEVNLLFAADYDWKWNGITLGPTASFQYTNVQLDGFTETGGFAPLSVIRKNADSARSALGFRATFDTKVGRAILRPEVRAAWQHEFGDTSYSLTSNFATLGGSAFTVAGPETGRDSLLVGAGFSLLLNDRFSIYAFYDGELLRANYSSHNVSAGFRYRF